MINMFVGGGIGFTLFFIAVLIAKVIGK